MTTPPDPTDDPEGPSDDDEQPDDAGSSGTLGDHGLGDDDVEVPDAPDPAD